MNIGMASGIRSHTRRFAGTVVSSNRGLGPITSTGIGSPLAILLPQPRMGHDYEKLVNFGPTLDFAGGNSAPFCNGCERNFLCNC
jgi:hypothetical protein